MCYTWIISYAQYFLYPPVYGEVEYFIVHNYNQSDRMFAYVRKTNSHKLDKFG